MTEREIDLLVAEDDPRDAALILAAIREKEIGAILAYWVEAIHVPGSL